MAWIYLIVAGLMEIDWPLGLKMAQTDGKRIFGIIIAILFMAASGGLLMIAQQTIPMGTAYSVWTGIGAVGTFLVGIVFYQDKASFGRWLGAFLIVSGVIIMKLAA